MLQLRIGQRFAGNAGEQDQRAEIILRAQRSPGNRAATKIANTSGIDPNAWFCRKMNILRGESTPHSLANAA